MNGMKLGTNQKANKNSFAFQNEFLNYDSDRKEDDEQDDDQDYSQSQQPDPSQSIKTPAKIEQKEKKIDLQISSKIQQKNQPPKEVHKIKNDEEVNRISKLNNGIEKLSVSVLEMKDNYQDLQLKEAILKKRNQRKQTQIKSFLQKKQDQKQKLEQRKNAQMEKDRRKLQQEIRIEKQTKENKSKQAVEQKLKKIIQLRQKREAEKQKSLEQSKLASHLYDKINDQQSNIKKFHIRKQEQDEKKRQQQRELQRQILAKRKQAYRSIDLYELQDHRRKYQQRALQLHEQKKLRRQQRLQSIEESNSKKEEFYLGQSYDYIQQQIQVRQHKKKAPKQKYNRVRQYEQYIRQNYLPKTHQPSKKSSVQQHSRRNSLSHKQVRRYRYFRGVACGEVLQNRPLAKSEAEQRQIGKQYLDYLKSLPKKKVVQENNTLSPEDLAILDKKLNSIVRVKQQRNPLYEKPGRQSVEVRISEKPTRDQVSMILDQLKSKDEQTKMKQKLLKHQNDNSSDLSKKHRQINDEMVANIQRKLNLLAKI